MSRDQQTSIPLGLAAELGDEDGLDPKEFHQKPWDQPKQSGRKARQLCHQVREALAGVLAASADEALLAVAVTAVTPASNTGRLRVTLSLPKDSGHDCVTVATQVMGAMGWLRSGVAAAINRRYVPELVFDVIGG